MSAVVGALVVGALGLGAVDLTLLRHSPQQVRPDSGVIKAAPLSARVSTTVVHAVKPAPTTVIAGFEQTTLNVNGVLRHYYLQTDGAKPGAPVVIALHGLNSSPMWIAKSTGLSDAARQNHVVLVVPVMQANAWNDGRLGPKGPDDQAFMLDLVKALTASGVANPHRVVITGFSNGAEMSLTMASLHPDVFSAVVSVVGELPAAPGSARPTGPIPAYFIHGMNDRIQPYTGRNGNGGLINALISEDETVGAFVDANHAHDPVTKDLPAGPDASGPLQQVTYAGEPSGAPVTLYKLPGVGHKWPAGANHKASNDNVVAAGLNTSSLIMTIANS